jgi:hypothetical protein
MLKPYIRCSLCMTLDLLRALMGDHPCCMRRQSLDFPKGGAIKQRKRREQTMIRRQRLGGGLRGGVPRPGKRARSRGGPQRRAGRVEEREPERAVGVLRAQPRVAADAEWLAMVRVQHCQRAVRRPHEQAQPAFRCMGRLRFRVWLLGFGPRVPETCAHICREASRQAPHSLQSDEDDRSFTNISGTSCIQIKGATVFVGLHGVSEHLSCYHSIS